MLRKCQNLLSQLRQFALTALRGLCCFLVALVLPAACATDVFNSVVNTLTTYVTAGGGLLAVWGAVTLGTNLKDHNGPGISQGVWQIVGGGVIIAAAQLFASVRA